MIVFSNPTELDLRLLTTFGASVKISENPIGYFGTGLKYALAVLARHEQQVTIHIGTTSYQLQKIVSEIRGKPFELLQLTSGEASGEGEAAPTIQLPFTTELGSKWKLWMAYRELFCNAKDEGGDSAEASEVVPTAGTTIIAVEGEAFQEVYASRASFILSESSPLYSSQNLELHPGSARGVFYRGLYVGNLERPSLFRYNILSKFELTEDRTLRSMFEFNRLLVKTITSCSNEEIIKTILKAKENFFEHSLDFDWSDIEPNETFLEIVGKLSRTQIGSINSSARRLFENRQKKAEPTEIKLTKVQFTMLTRAIAFLAKLGYSVEDYPIKAVESLGKNVLGMAKDETIYLSSTIFEQGTKQVASTLMEEYIHLRFEYSDCTYQMQTVLFNKVISLGEELQGEPL